MTIKKITILLLSLAMCAGFLTGCGEKSASDKAADAVDEAADTMKDALN